MRTESHRRSMAVGSTMVLAVGVLLAFAGGAAHAATLYFDWAQGTNWSDSKWSDTSGGGGSGYTLA